MIAHDPCIAPVDSPDFLKVRPTDNPIYSGGKIRMIRMRIVAPNLWSSSYDVGLTVYPLNVKVLEPLCKEA